MQNGIVIALSVLVVLLSILLLIALTKCYCVLLDNKKLAAQNDEIVRINRGITADNKSLRNQSSKLLSIVKDRLLRDKEKCKELAEMTKQQIDEKLSEFVPLIIKQAVGVLRDNIAPDIKVDKSVIAGAIDYCVQSMQEGFLGCVDNMQVAREHDIKLLEEQVEEIWNNTVEEKVPWQVSEIAENGMYSVKNKAV